MTEEKGSKAPSEKEKGKSLLGWFITREEPDQDYLPDLKTQWELMNRTDRVKFVIGAVVGAVLFIGALLLVYMILSAIVG